MRSGLGWPGDNYGSYSHTKANEAASEWDETEHQALGVKLKLNSKIVSRGLSETVFMWCSVAMQDSLGIEEREPPKVERLIR